MAKRLRRDETINELRCELDRLRLELIDARQQQAASAEVFKAMSRSPADLNAALATLVESAAKLCGCNHAAIYLQDGNGLRGCGFFGARTEEEKEALGQFLAINRKTVSGRVMLSGQIELITDVNSDCDYDYAPIQQWSSARTLLGVPLIRQGVVEGVLSVAKREPGSLSLRHGEILQPFADQAVIAIENVRLFEEVQARTREATEALEYQTATSDVLGVISRSPTDVQPVVDTIARSAARLCEAQFCFVYRYDGRLLHFVAHHGITEESANIVRNTFPVVPTRGSAAERSILSLEVEQIPNLALDDEFTHRAAAAFTGLRSAVAVPMLRDGQPIGCIAVGRAEAGLLPAKQVELLQTFADQAVIAIENARLFDEVQRRTRELQESLDYQTATSEVLNAISRSPTELQPVLDVIVETAVRLCEADAGTIARQRNGQFVRSGTYGFSSEFAEAVASRPVEMTRGSITGRTLLEGKVVQILDAEADPDYNFADALRLDRIRTGLGVPLLREGAAIGAIALVRRSVRQFTDKQIALVTTFADQAVIAIENVRLFDEVQRRNREVTEALEQQTATSTILRVIAASPTDIQPVLDSVAESAARLCDAYDAAILLKDGAVLTLKAHFGPIPIDFANWPIGRDWVTGRAFVDRRPVHVPDLAAAFDEFPAGQAMAERLGHRSILAMPLLREDEAIGSIVIRRLEVRPFAQKQIDLLKTFADQAVIAIENVRLFDEVQKRTAELGRSVDELKALGEVSQAVNSTLDLKTVLETIVAKAVQLSGTDAGAIYVYSKSADRFRLRATYGMSAELIDAISRQIIGLKDPGLGEAARLRRPIQLSEFGENAATAALKTVREAGFRSILVVPLLRPDKVIGALVVRRRTSAHFSDSTIHLMETFAAQSVLAIQNARLFSEIEEKGRQLEVASRHKSQFLANMSHELRTPLNSVLGFTEMLADGLYGDLPEKAKAALARIETNGKHLLGLINDVLDLSKIEAGQLQLVVDDYSPAQIIKAAVAVTEPLARAKGLTLTTKIADDMPFGHGDERRLTQVLINLLGNAAKFTEAGSIEITAFVAHGQIEISIRDSGPGIAPEHQTRIFEEFQQVDASTTRKKGGSGLGLAISKRIIEMHRGSIGVRSAIGAGSTFFVTIPLKAN